MPPARLTFVTGNAGKLREASAWLHLPVDGVAAALDELQTTDLGELVRHKAAQAWAQVGRPVMVEDTALVFRAWEALPGPFVKFFLAHLGLEGMVRALEPFPDKSAEAVCAVGYHDGTAVHVFTGRVAGRIVPPRGDHGFGWDPLFQPDGSDRTYGEMPTDEKARYSMRARALAALAAHLGTG